MARQTKLPYMSESDYLKAEKYASVRHEYVDGHLFAMTGATDAHNIICGNLFSAIHAYLRGSSCKAYMNDMKIKIESAKSFYYPDIMVSCEPFEAQSVFKIRPVLLIEVLSRSTKQIDLREKLVAYQKIESLQEYVVVHQDRQHIDIYRRLSGNDWELSVLTRLQDLVLESLPVGQLKLPFSLVYEGYEPPSRVKESESAYQV